MDKKTLENLQNYANNLMKKEYNGFAELDKYEMINDYDGDYYENLVFRVGVEESWQETIDVYYDEDMSEDFVVGMLMGNVAQLRK